MITKWITKKNVLVSLIVAFILGYIVLFQENIHLCTLVNEKYYRNCVFSDWTQNSIGAPLFWFSLVMLVSTLIVYKLENKIFSAWLKLSAVFIPIALVLIERSPEGAYGGGLASVMTITRAHAAYQLSVMYLLLSLMVISFKLFSLRKK